MSGSSWERELALMANGPQGIGQSASFLSHAFSAKCTN
jgi:hypothetical protein